MPHFGARVNAYLLTYLITNVVNNYSILMMIKFLNYADDLLIIPNKVSPHSHLPKRLDILSTPKIISPRNLE